MDELPVANSKVAMYSGETYSAVTDHPWTDDCSSKAANWAVRRIPSTAGNWNETCRLPIDRRMDAHLRLDLAVPKWDCRLPGP
jgi:hypothetical protein